MARRVERYALQAVARDILPKSRTALCLRTRIKGGEGVGVWKCECSGTAHYSGLIVCGSVWTCPVCGAKISEKRRGELNAAIEQHKSRGGDVLLLTLTTPHARGDDLAALVAQRLGHSPSGAQRNLALVRQPTGEHDDRAVGSNLVHV